MPHRVCPPFLGFLLASPIRRLFNDHPAKILGPYVRPGMTVLEPGPGMGYFTLEAARLVGPSGRVLAVDIQPKMLDGVRRRATAAGLADRVQARLAGADSMALGDLDGAVDFVLAFAVVHEFPSAARFFAEAARAMKPGAALLLSEPPGHVKADAFAAELAAAAQTGLALQDRPAIRGSVSALLKKAA